MVLKVFIAAGDEISLQFWLLSINHIDPLWIRLGAARMRVCAWGRGGGRSEGEETGNSCGVICLFAAALLGEEAGFSSGPLAVSRPFRLWFFVLLYKKQSQMLFHSFSVEVDSGGYNGSPPQMWVKTRNTWASLI